MLQNYSFQTNDNKNKKKEVRIINFKKNIYICFYDLHLNILSI